MKGDSGKTALTGALLYIAFGIAWIMLSDLLIAASLSDISARSAFRPYLPWLFLALSALFIYVMSRYHLSRRDAVEMEMRESEAPYRQIFESSPSPMWVYDIETLRFLAVNDAAVAHYGYSREEFLKMTILDIRPQEDWERLQQNIQAITDGLDRAGIWRHYKKDGTLIDVDITSHTVRFGSRRAELVLITDRSPLKQAEAEIFQADQRLQLMLAAADVGTWEVDLTSPFRNLVWSDTYGELFGLRRDQFPRTEEEFFDLIHPDDCDLVWRAFSRAISEDTRYDCEFRVIWPDGAVHWHLALGRVTKDDKGTPIRMIGVGRNITEQKRMEERLHSQLRRAESLHAIDVSIANSLEVRLTLHILVESVVTHLGVDAADILLFRRPGNSLEFVAGHGFLTDTLTKYQGVLGEGHAGRTARDRQRVFVPDIARSGEDSARVRLLTGEGFVAYVGVPLLVKGQLKGVLEAFHRSPLNPHEDWFAFLEKIAGQASTAIDNAQLVEDLQRANTELSLAYEAVIEGWSRAMDIRDREAEGHTRRVADLSVSLAHAMGMSEAEIVHVRRGALLHDLGKLGVPDNIQLKPANLTDEEWTVMRQHPQFAFDMLSGIEYLRPALDVPYCHHEKWDGTGYPRGLKGSQIPLAARIFAVADVWDSLRSDRPYRPGWPAEKVSEHIRSLAGKDFDPKVVELFLKLIDAPSPGERSP